MKTEPLPGRGGGLGLRLLVARGLLGWERLAQAFWPAVALTCGLLAVALLDLLPLLPGWLHAGVLVAGLGVLGWQGLRGAQRLRWPSAAETLRRLERHNQLAHRPLAGLGDRPAGNDAVAAALWQLHRQALQQATARLRLFWPQPDLAARDPQALRVLAGLVLCLAAAGSWGDWQPRLLAAFQPRLDGGAGEAAAALDLWLTPPAYTGAAPLFLSQAGQKPAADAAAGPSVAVLVGSAVMARVSGGTAVPVLVVNGGEAAFTALDDSHFQIEGKLVTGQGLAVRQGGRSLGHWPVTLTPDQPPSVAFVTPPMVAERGLLRVEARASDDYGVATLAVSLRLDQADRAGADLTLPLALPADQRRQVQVTTSLDLTASSLAGLPVLISLVATDGAGQSSRSAELPLVLPERSFNHPVARAIIAERRTLALSGDLGRRPVAQALAALAARPGAYHDDSVVFLALKVAVAQLVLDAEPEALVAVRGLLWETALRLEDGVLSLAARDLKAAEQALAEALDRNATPDELRQRLDDLQAALEHFLETLQQQQQLEDDAAGPPPALPPLASPNQLIERADLDSLMQNLRDLTEAGVRDGARQRLAELQQLMDSLQRGGTQNGGPSAADAKALAQNQEIFKQLQQLTERQQKLLDQSYREAEAPAPPPPSLLPLPFGLPAPGTGSGGGSGAQNQSQDQNQLRQELGGLMQQLGEVNGAIPRPLGQAERAMRDAEQAMKLGPRGAAVPAQTQAVDHLQQGLQALRQMMASQSAGGTSGRDPLGRRRPGPGSLEGSGVHLPEQRELQRAREIRDELRRRAGQRERTRPELDYIDRLLRQF